MASAWKYKRKDSPFWWIGFYTNGKKGKPFSCKIKNERQAELYRKDYERNLTKQENEQLVHVPENAGMLFSQAFELYKQDKSNSGRPLTNNTIQNHKITLNRFIAACGDKPVYQYSREDFNKFISYMGTEELDHNTKASNSGRVKAVFQFLVKDNYIKENPFRAVTAKIKEVRILSAAQIKMVRDYAASTKFADFVEFQILTAFRLDEAVFCNAKDIKDGRITVDAKGGGRRSIPVGDELKAWLEYYYKKAQITLGEDKRLFNFSYSGASFFWQRANKKLKLGRGMGSHAMRKYTLSNMANSGVAINFVKEYAGHSSIKTTMQYYVKTDYEKMAEELNKKVVFLDNKA